MGTLLDKIRHLNGARIPAHEFADTLMVWAETWEHGGSPTWGKSRADIIAWWDLEASDEAELDALVTRFQALAAAVDAGARGFWADRIERAFRLLQEKKMIGEVEVWFWTDAQFRDYLGL
jgi:hypothetical protein